MTLRLLGLFALALLALPLAAGPAGAADGPLFAGYWSEFVDHWTGVLRRQNGVVLFALGVGAVCLFIITRAKWKK
ncbi:MAG: hypothetical protein ACKODX_08035 [Gemmata sp.]